MDAVLTSPLNQTLRGASGALHLIRPGPPGAMAYTFESLHARNDRQNMGNMIAFLQWFGVSLLLFSGFAVVYRYVTPHPEIRLIREGNISTAVAFGAAMLGYALPLASVMIHGATLYDLTVWGLVAMLVQLLVYLALRALFKDYTRHIAEDRMGTAVFGGFVSVAVGILNAAAQGG